MNAFAIHVELEIISQLLPAAPLSGRLSKLGASTGSPFLIGPGAYVRVDVDDYRNKCRACGGRGRVCWRSGVSW